MKRATRMGKSDRYTREDTRLILELASSLSNAWFSSKMAELFEHCVGT